MNHTVDMSGMHRPCQSLDQLCRRAHRLGRAMEVLGTRGQSKAGPRHPLPAGLVAASLLAPLVALIALSLLSARLVRANALESAAQQAELLEEATKEFSRNVERVEQAKFPVNKTVPPTPNNAILPFADPKASDYPWPPL